MKYISNINEFFGNKNNEGDAIVNRILEIVEEENINIKHTGGYQIEIDDNIYSFSSYGSLLVPDCNVSIYDKSQKYGSIITGKPKSTYNFSKKIWKQLERIYKEQNKSEVSSDLDVLDDTRRKAKKYNL